MPINDYLDYDGTALAFLVATKQLTAEELFQEYRTRLQAYNPTLNAVVHEFEADCSSFGKGPFGGVPLLVKNIGLPIQATAMTMGSRLYDKYVCAMDSTLTTRLRNAGFVFAGRTNTPELALSLTTESELHGPARNPWDLSRSAGGSSGGAASAVASGMVPLAHSSDGAGSTRVPAAHNGVFGFKPSRIRNPLGPTAAEAIAGMSTPHAVSRSVRDSAVLLDVTSGPDIGDPYSVPPAEVPFGELIKSPLARLKIGLQLECPLGLPLDPECRAAAISAAELCQALGHTVEVACFDHDEQGLKEAWRTIAAVSLAKQVTAFAETQSIRDPLTLLEPVNAEWFVEGQKVSGVSYLKSVEALHAVSRAMGRYFERFDVYLSPTTAQLPPPLGTLTGQGLSLDTFFDRFWAHSPFTAMFNASGCPAMSVPLYWTERSIPVGIQFGAGFGADGVLFRLARELELARPWFHRRPPLFAAQALSH